MPSYHKVHSREYESWKVALQLNHSRESIPSRQRKNQVWHFHGDSLSSLLFCIALAHLSLLLNDSTDGHMSQYGELSHIFCVDDLKTFAKDDGQQQGLLTIVKTFSGRVTLRWNLVLKRCAKATFKRRRLPLLAIFILDNSTTVKELEQERTYNYYINTNEIPGELSRENLISSHVKISPLLWLHNKSRLSHQKTIKVKWFGISVVFT